MLKITDDEFNSLVEAGFFPWQILETESHHYASRFGDLDRKTLNKFLKLDKHTLHKLKVYWDVWAIMKMCEVPRLIPWLKKQPIDTLKFIAYYSFYDIIDVWEWVGANHILDFYTQAGKIDFLFMGVTPICGVDSAFVRALKKFSMEKIRGMYQNITRQQIIDKIKVIPNYEEDEGALSMGCIERIRAINTPAKKLRLRRSLFKKNNIIED